MKSYAGIGSRSTPNEVLAVMREVGVIMARNDYTLRSGAAAGADSAFEAGCDRLGGAKEIFIPWNGFNGRHASTPGIIIGHNADAVKLAESFHPAWDRCSQGARKLHTRNCYQMLGVTLDDPVEFVMCYTPGGTGGGGTGQALRIAKAHNIPIYDLGNTATLAKVVNRINELLSATKDASCS